MEREKVNYAVAVLCRVLDVSPSGYYAWRTRGQSRRAQEDAVLSERIAVIHQESRETYGAPRIHAELQAEGVGCGRKRVARLMRQAQLVGCHRRRSIMTTQREPAAPVVPDRVERQFVAAAPNLLWSAAITFVPTGMGFLSLAVVLDVCSRRIVGRAMVGALWALCAPSSSSRPSTWRSGTAVPSGASSTTRIMVASIRV